MSLIAGLKQVNQTILGYGSSIPNNEGWVYLVEHNELIFP